MRSLILAIRIIAYILTAVVIGYIIYTIGAAV